ncbi:MAG: hypothetical protein C0616_05850 [Desulfuromonas sp.]|nr:MAG: hypothetical protein C0616_05850 [Desulfuromonas sp.]
MSLFRRKYIGLAISGGELRAVSLLRHGRQSKLAGGRLLTLSDGIWDPSPYQPNIKDVARFIARLREVITPLAGHEKRIALSLPASCARVVVAEFETVFKNKEEGAQLIRWQMKNSLPGPSQDAVVDFQRLNTLENGRQRYLVAAMAGAVLEQYEAALEGAGLHGLNIAFQPLHIGQFYHRRLDTAEPTLLVALEGGELSLQCYQEKLLRFFRQRRVQQQPEAVFQEINRSLSAMQEEFPNLSRAGILLHSDWEQQEGLAEAVQGLFSKSVIVLDPRVEQMAIRKLNLPSWRVRGLTGAIGAAEQMM